jgi:hypothetical protein
MKKDVIMRSMKPAALVLGLTAFVAVTSGAQVHAQAFGIAEVTSTAGLGVDQLKPKTIAFLDRPTEELIDPDAGLIRFEDWAQAKPIEKQFLSPFPSYLEPYSEITVDGVRKRFKEKLHMYGGALCAGAAAGLDRSCQPGNASLRRAHRSGDQAPPDHVGGGRVPQGPARR